MGATLERLGIERMSVVERLELIGLIWDSIAESETSTPTPDWHLHELERRRAVAEADPQGGIPWEVVKARLSSPK